MAAVLGSAITVAAMVAGGGTGSASFARQKSIVSIGRSGGEQLSANEIYERTAPSVVNVRARSVQSNGRTAFDATTGSEFNLSTGSGFLYGDDGHVVTNAHVISGATAVNVTYPDGQTVTAHVIGKDEQTDLAVLAVDHPGADLQPLEFGDSAALHPGDQVVAVGNPSGMQTNAGSGRIAASGQRVEAPGGYLINDVFETDAVIEPASSGGPLIGPDGRVVGVTFRLPDEGAINGYAVPADTARDVIGKLEDAGKVIRPYLGLRGTVTAGGVQVTQVHAGGPADEAGVHEGDVVESIDGRPVTTLGELFGTVDEHSPGESVELGVLRDGSRGGITVDLLERPATVPSG